MKIRKMLWITAGLLMFLLFRGNRETERIRDGEYKNAYVHLLEDEKMTVTAEGKTWTVPCLVGKKVRKKDCIVDISVEDRKIRKVVWKEGAITDRAEAIDPAAGWIRLRKKGEIPLASGWKAYMRKGKKVIPVKYTGSLINWDLIRVTILNGQAEAVVSVKKPEKKKIKVLIHGNRKGIYHDEIRMTASEDFTVFREKEGQEAGTVFQAGEEVLFQGDDPGGRICCEKGTLRLLQKDRETGFPEYEGEFYISREPEGLILRNEVDLEEYLNSVVSGEMPSVYPEEALNAQAVCARTYALYQMERSYYSAYGANVDDTVNSQVYNRIPATKESRKAVEDTAGQYLTYKGNVIPAYFYSTSCGMTSDVGDVWPGEEDLPFLSGTRQEKGKKETDLSDESDFKAFLSEKGDFFEKNEGWFRWETLLSPEKLEQHINRNLSFWLMECPEFCRLEGKEKRGERGIGPVKKIMIEERSPGGVLKKVVIGGETGKLSVEGEYGIRKVLCPEGTEVKRQDETFYTCNMLPSGYFRMEAEKDGIRIFGGGYGHGVGMSQNGAKAMAGRSCTYNEILHFYYPGTEQVYGY